MNPKAEMTYQRQHYGDTTAITKRPRILSSLNLAFYLFLFFTLGLNLSSKEGMLLQGKVVLVVCKVSVASLSKSSTDIKSRLALLWALVKPLRMLSHTKERT
jgi:hypothetical protein